ncbi:MAG TPA: transglutaminase family protein [Acidimicrobiales bacterium]|nr:transglutaminase family protein [Acidimicrobiales bacterium]
MMQGPLQMRFEIRYSTEISYDGLVRENHNELRAAPTSNDHQQLITYRVTVQPGARVVSFVDYWGTRVDAFGIREPHVALGVVSEATVETSEPSLVTVSPGRSDLTEPSFVEEHSEYLDATAKTDPGPRVIEIAEAVDAMTEGDVVGAVLAVHRQIHRRLVYEPGATTIATSAEDVLAHGAGVCQDYAHAAVAICRSLSIPARYVSGYFFAADHATGADSEGDVVEVATHAWFEAAVPGHGWLALDPTNSLQVGPRHVKIGSGRDYDDVPPIRGVLRGGSGVKVESVVEMRRLVQQQQQQ